MSTEHSLTLDGLVAEVPLISFVLPVKGDVRVFSAIERLKKFAALVNKDAEFLVCGQIDSCLILDSVSYVEVNPPHKGKAVREGILRAQGSIVIICDSDLPASSAELKEMLDSLVTADIVIGKRYSRTKGRQIYSSIIRNKLSIIFQLLVERLFGLNGIDTQCGLKAIKKSKALLLIKKQIIQGLAFDVDLILHAKIYGMKLAVTPVEWLSTSGSTINLWAATLSMLIDILYLWILWKFNPYLK